MYASRPTPSLPVREGAFVTSDLHSECAEIGNCNPLIIAGQSP